MMPDLLQDDRHRFLEQTSSLWEDMRGENVFVTGGTGFIGCWLLESFVWANEHFGLGASATVLSRDAAAFNRKAPHLASHPSIRVHSGDVRTFEFPDGAFRYLIHAATDARAQAALDAPLETIDTIIDGTRRTLEFARTHGVRQYLLTSSGAVYGKQPTGLSHIPEDYAGAPDSAAPGSAYGQAKRLAELLCAIYTSRYGVSCTMARCFAFAGPYLPSDGHFAFGSFVRDAVLGQPIDVNGDGTPVRSYLYAMDLAIWLWTILFRGKPGGAYNVGSERDIRVGELAAEVASIVPPNFPVQVGSDNRHPERKPSRYVPSTTLARTELGLEEYTDRKEAIRRTAQWYKQWLTVRCP